jgi:tRNA1Val (adenine37-N6)-methyltransferase
MFDNGMPTQSGPRIAKAAGGWAPQAYSAISTTPATVSSVPVTRARLGACARGRSAGSFVGRVFSCHVWAIRVSFSDEESELTDDALAGPFRLWQRRRGHRYSLDDVTTAWVAARARPDARCVLDLGCGIGSVLLMLLYKLPLARAWGLEAQLESFELLARNCARNGVMARARLLHGDLRDEAQLERLLGQARALGSDGFELVTGTPPYQPLGRGSISPDLQRAHARVELRGGVEAYLRAAGRLLAPGGSVVVCADARHPERVERGAAEAGLKLVRRMDVVPLARRPALFTAFTLARASDVATVACERACELVARDGDGRRTAAALELRAFFDLPLPITEPPSPRLRARTQAVKVG